jgi:hypothetical protein
MDGSTTDKYGCLQSRESIGNFAGEDEEHLTVPHKVLIWPMIHDHLVTRGSRFAQDLRDISSQGSLWFVEKSKWTPPTFVPTLQQTPITLSTSSDTPNPANIPATRLLHQYGEVTIKGYVEAYFRTFNEIRPILDKAFFIRETEFQLLYPAPLGRETEAVLLLLVIALGQVVYEGTAGVPIESFMKRSSGIRGGTALLSPGTICFEEALRRWTLIRSSPSLLGVQALLLQASFHECSARHWDFWKCAVSASTVCEHLIKERDFHWSTPAGEMLKRTYWACVLDEGYYHHDLDLPETGIFAFQDEVPLPSFVRDVDEPTTAGIESVECPKAYLHFLALISLKRLVDRIHDVVNESMSLIRQL